MNSDRELRVAKQMVLTMINQFVHMGVVVRGIRPEWVDASSSKWGQWTT
jgi:hypothetical protein